MTRHVGEQQGQGAAGEIDARRVEPGTASEIARLLELPETFAIMTILALGVMLLVPAGWLAAVPACAALAVWKSTRRHRLPFRLPMDARSPDYSNPEPGTARRFRKGQGLLFLGNEHSSNEELWITNSDARRHALILGTTGAGKALPVDTPVLTPGGWRANGSLKPGDKVTGPSGAARAVLSVHPQGRMPVVRLGFADGRFADCSRDHLWLVCSSGADHPFQAGGGAGRRLMTAVDIAILLEAQAAMPPGNGRLRLFIPLVGGIDAAGDAGKLTPELALRAGRDGLDALAFMPSLAGTAGERRRWCCLLLQERRRRHAVRAVGTMLEIPILGGADGHRLRHLVWSLGGTAMQILAGGRQFVLASFPGQHLAFAGAPPGNPQPAGPGIEIISAEAFAASAGAMDARGVGQAGAAAQMADGPSGPAPPTPPREVEMTCIRTDAPDGLFVIENYIVTHNTELLLGIAAQSMMWSSGFLFIDGKGTAEFHARVWSLVSRFGRQDDYRVLNFTDSGGHPDDPAGGPAAHSNTLNPFSHGTADQLMNLVVSLMSDSGTAGDMWKGRAMSLVTSTMKALCEMRDAGDVLLDVQSIRDYLPLGSGVRKEFLDGREIGDITDVPEAAWAELRTRGGMIELYLRALHGEFSERSRLALKGFFDSLPGFNLEAALNGEPQQGKAVEQHGFLSMQLTRPLGSLADDFGHIFRTPFGEVDIEDVVLNRRILVVLLPALQKAPEEMRNCGKIVVAMLKMMMGRVAGSVLEGSKQALIDARPTRSASPFIAILDEAGYYMVKGIDTMMAQARSLGFMIIIAGQDMAAMQSVSPQIAETVAANARLTAAGATEDAQRTWGFLQHKFAKHTIAVASGRSARPGMFGSRWVERPDVTFTERDRVRIGDLQKLREGEFYFLMESRLVKARVFHIGEDWTPWISMNKFLLIRGPTDSAPGLDQSQDTEFLVSMEAAGRLLLDPDRLARRFDVYPFDSRDALYCAIRYSGEFLSPRTGAASPSEQTDADLLGILFGSPLGIPN